MIKSILDNDLYKFTQQNAVMKLYPKVKVSYKFYNRGKNKFPIDFAERLRAEVKKMELLKLTKEEKAFFASKSDKYLDPVYLDFLEGYRYDSQEIGIIQNGSSLEIQISGYWYRTILWEVPLMAIISQLYFEMTGEKKDSDEVISQRNQLKAASLKKIGAPLAELGTRRRYSFEEQNNAVKAFIDYSGKCFVGTSNVYIGFLHNINIIGTQAHEWFMFHAVFSGFKSANIASLNAWKRVYKGYLGTALTDTLTTDDFFRVFSKEYAEIFSGVRHDSGCPMEFADKTIAHYESLGIDPMTKSIIFSDGLDMDKVESISNYCEGRIKYSFGMGTHLSNDVGVKALNMVIKLDTVTIPGLPPQYCIKISDSLGKFTGNEEMFKIALLTLGLTDILKQYENENGKIEIDYQKLCA